MDQFSSHPLYRRHNIDSAMSSLWEFYKKKFFSLFLISLVMTLMIQYVSTFVNLKEIQSVTDPIIRFEMLKEYIVPVIIILLINLLSLTILHYYIIYGPLNSQDNIYVTLLKSLNYFIPYLIIIVLLAFAGSIVIVLGILALVIGVFFSILYIMTLFLFILPVMMVEGANIASTISRTITLAHKNFWSNIGWVAVFLIILIVISVIFSGIIILPLTGNFVKTIINPEDASALVDMTNNPMFIFLSAIVSAITLPLLPIFASILYFNGKAGEEQRKTVTPVNRDNEKVRVEDLYAKPYTDDHPENPENKG